MSTPTKMRMMWVVDSIIQIVPVLVAFAWFVASWYEIAVGGLSSLTALGLPIIGAFSVSSVTVILYTSFYLYTFYHLNYLLAHVRVVVTLAFTMLGMSFTRLTFSTTIISATIYFCLFFIICVVLWYYNSNRKNHFFAFPFSFVALVIYYALMRILATKLIELPIYGDEFMQNAILRFVSIWIWGDLYQKRGGLKK